MHRIRLCLRALLFSVCMTLPCFAQLPGDEEPQVKNYVICYFVVGLGIALGVIVVCRPSKRTADIKRPSD
jgi:hypothetical protein